MSDLLTVHCSGVLLDGLLWLPHSVRSRMCVCVVPVSFMYVTRLPRLITQQAAPLVRSPEGKNVWHADCVVLLLFTDHKEWTLMCLLLPYVLDKIYLNTNVWHISCPVLLTLKFLTLTNAAADDDKTSCYILINIWQARVQGETKTMQISVATSVLHDGTQQDFSPHPAVTTPREIKKDATQRQHWWDNKTVEIGSWTENGSGRDTGDRCLVGGW